MMKNGRPAWDALGMPGKQVDERLKKNYEFRRELYFVLRKSDWAVVVDGVVGHASCLMMDKWIMDNALFALPLCNENRRKK